MTRGVSELYDAWAHSYDEDENRTRDLAGRVLRSVLSPPRGDVLELGCGTGANTVWLAHHARSVTALDFSEGMLRRARERVTRDNVRLVRHDLHQPLPLADGCADLVAITLVIEHLRAVAPVVAESARMLRPGGELLICEYHPFRQLTGGQARFRPRSGPGDGELEGAEVRIPAHLHMVSEYVSAGLAASLTLLALQEWGDADAQPGAAPRVLSLHWSKPGSA